MLSIIRFAILNKSSLVSGFTSSPAVFAVLVPVILLLKGIYGSFLFTFSIPVLWQVVYLKGSLSFLGLKKRSLAISLVLGVASGIILGLLGGKVLQLLGLTGHSFISSDSLGVGIGAFKVSFSLAKELGYQLLAKSSTTIGLILYFLFNILLVGLGEEILWRGFIQRKIARKTTVTAAIWITAALFALIHFYIFIILPFGKGIILLVLIGIAGAIWGYLCERMGSIWGAAVSHGIAAAIIWKYYFITLIVSVIIGIFIGIIFNFDYRLSLLAGYAGTDILEGIYKSFAIQKIYVQPSGKK
jgi:membrane protease YdiL (CAAX protease family)